MRFYQEVLECPLTEILENSDYKVRTTSSSTSLGEMYGTKVL